MTGPSSALALSLLLFPAVSQVGAVDGDTVVTDPRALVSMGFPPDATGVFIAKGALLDQKGGGSPQEFGIASSSYVMIPGNQFMPRATSSFGTFTGRGDIFYVSGDPAYDGQIDVPTGAVLESVRLW